MKDNTTFTKAELEANDLAFKKLVEFVQSGDAILMAGAGCSGALYPTWGGFIDIMEKEALITNPDFSADKKDSLSFADKVKECLGNDHYYGLIYDTFKPSDTDTHLSYHVNLCRLPFKAITTTNYDKVLEYALTVVTGDPNNSLHFEGTTKKKIHDFIRSLNFNKSLKKLVVHLHGVYDVEDSIVLGGKEYSSKYGFELEDNEDTLFDQLQGDHPTRERLSELLIKYGYEWPLRRKLLWALLATRKIVFIGFSMADPYFMKMLDFVKDDLSTYNAETHFLILRVTPSSLNRSIEHAARLKREYGIQTVFFQDDNDKYTGLSQFIAELENQVGIEVNKVEPEQKTDIIEVTASQGDVALTDTLFSLSREQFADED